MMISILLNIGTLKFVKTLHTPLIVKKHKSQIKILDEINFFLIIIYMLIQLKVFIYVP